MARNGTDLKPKQEAAIAALTTDPQKRREAQYQRAYALYQDKKQDDALPLFKELAVVRERPDSYAIQSQHLALEILAQKKDYKAILAQANTWIRDPRFDGWTVQDSKHGEEDVEETSASSSA